MTAAPVDIALVRMPYSDLSQPSLGLGLLKACCDRYALTSRVVQANLSFAEAIGPAIHDLVFSAYSSTLIGEWTFAAALFPDYEPDDDAYLAKATRIFALDNSLEWRHLRARYPYFDCAALLRDIRSRASGFIEETADRVLALSPRIVGCTSTFQQHCASLALLRAVKARRPETITMIGGANCEGDMGRATFEQFPFVDFAVSGEADAFFGALCARLINDGPDAAMELPEGVWGPRHRRSASSASAPHIDGAPIARIEDLNESPVPNYDDYFAALADTRCLGAHLRPALPFQTARGCWWGEKTHCTFCGISRTAMKFRAKSADNVMEQMLALRERYGITSFQGTEYIFDYRFFKTLLPRLAEIGGHFRFEVKANLKEEQLEAFAASGTVEVQPGVESLHDRVLALLNKGTTALQNVQLLKRGRKVGLLIYWNLLHTVPGDRDEWYGEMADLVPLLTHLQPPAAFAQIHYDRFSPYWREPSRYGLTLRPAFGYEQVYPFPPSVLADLAYFFETPEQRERFLVFDPVAQHGLMRLVGEVHKWRTAFYSSAQPRPRLWTTDDGERIVFEDTRAIASEAVFSIDGLARRIYLAAGAGIRPDQLAPALMADPADAGDAGDAEKSVRSDAALTAAIDLLVERRVIAHLSGRLVALGVSTPVPPFLAERVQKPREELVPIVGKLRADVVLDEQRPSVMLQCLRRPQDEPLTGWLSRRGGRGEASPRAPEPAQPAQPTALVATPLDQ